MHIKFSDFFCISVEKRLFYETICLQVVTMRLSSHSREAKKKERTQLIAACHKLILVIM
jgi:hypothetical protein